jgi:hypothetical protein
VVEAEVAEEVVVEEEEEADAEHFPADAAGEPDSGFLSPLPARAARTAC